MSSTNFFKNKALDLSFGNTSYTPPSNYYLGLSTTSISSSGSNATEPSGYGYARVQVPNDKSHFSVASSGCLVMSASAAFPISTGSWGTVTSVFLSDALTSGSIWHFTTLPSPKTIDTDTTISFSASAITFSMT